MTQPFNKPVRTPNEFITTFGARLLTFLMASDDYLLGLLDDDELSAAHYACNAALAGRVNLGDKDNPQTSPAIVFDRIEDMRRLIGASQRRRDAEAAAARRERDALLQRFASVYPKGGQMPGPRMVVDDITPKPKLPPTAAMAVPAFALTAADVANEDDL